MIFVTVGNAEQPFPRLLDAVESLVAEGVFGAERILMQVGAAKAKCQSCECIPLLTSEEFGTAIADAQIIICHGGAGTLIQALRAGRRPIVMPRLKRWNETVDDHQLELVQALAERDLVTVVMDRHQLREAARQHNAGLRMSAPKKSPLVSLVAAALHEVARSH